MNLLTSLRLRIVRWLTSFLEDRYQPAGYDYTDGPEPDALPRMLTDEQADRLLTEIRAVSARPTALPIAERTADIVIDDTVQRGQVMPPRPPVVTADPYRWTRRPAGPIDAADTNFAARTTELLRQADQVSPETAARRAAYQRAADQQAPYRCDWFAEDLELTDADVCALLAGADGCRRCPVGQCHGMPERRPLTAADRADIAEDQRHVRRADGNEDHL